MQYSPKLKRVMEDIKAILDKEDVGAIIILHEPGATEFVNKVNPSYSCASFEGDELRIKAKLQEDFGGDKQAWTQKVSDTYNMIHHFVSISANMYLTYSHIEQLMKKHVEVVRKDDGGSTSHNQQNN